MIQRGGVSQVIGAKLPDYLRRAKVFDARAKVWWQSTRHVHTIDCDAFKYATMSYTSEKDTISMGKNTSMIVLYNSRWLNVPMSLKYMKLSTEGRIQVYVTMDMAMGI